ncbi:MAG TPA: DNA polymerase III subunit epsilon [Steroidobacteraceae bacterium]|nr:DNA polymerase III subunit epsilon [Steroidobacteraceae bacterium]
MRQIILDTETTGLEPAQGHRIIEIGCVELVNRRATGRTFQRYLNPERDIDPGAEAVHGLSGAFLADQPRFAEVAEEFVGFVSGAELIIHNAPFDVAFIDHEFGRLPPPQRLLTDLCTILDTLALARQLHPGQRNSLDALCKRYGVDNSNRELHGALLDARILADVYLAMTGGQGALTLHAQADDGGRARAIRAQRRGHIEIPVIRATAEELEAHERALDSVAKASKGRCLFRAPPAAADEPRRG